jgi:hypothetical protein
MSENSRLRAPDLKPLQARIPGKHYDEFARKARRSKLSLAEYTRQVVAWDIDPENPYNVEALVRMREAQEKESQRREGVRADGGSG